VLPLLITILLILAIGGGFFLDKFLCLLRLLILLCANYLEEENTSYVSEHPPRSRFSIVSPCPEHPIVERGQ
jgi:hypothetical protein